MSSSALWAVMSVRAWGPHSTLTALEAHQTILDQIEAAKAIVAGDLVEGDDDLGELHHLAVDGDGLAGLKLNLGVGRGVRRVLGGSWS